MSKICCEGFAFAMPVTSWPSFSPWDQLPARFHAEPRVTAVSGLKFGRASWEKKDEDLAKCNSCVRMILSGKPFQHFDMLAYCLARQRRRCLSLFLVFDVANVFI